jgi:RimJ/RimL family protein N-acetyltransferase
VPRRGATRAGRTIERFGVIDGRVVRLRAVERRHLELLASLANDPTVAHSVVGWSLPVSMAHQERWFEASLGDRATQRLIIVDRDSEEPVGMTGLWDIDWHDRSALTATKLLPTAQGRGIGTDAILTLAAWAFLDVGLRRLYSTILDFNAASLGAYVRRCGWRIEGRERQAVYRSGRWCDRYLIALLREDFEGHPDAAFYKRSVCPVDVEAVVPPPSG